MLICESEQDGAVQFSRESTPQMTDGFTAETEKNTDSSSSEEEEERRLYSNFEALCNNESDYDNEDGYISDRSYVRLNGGWVRATTLLFPYVERAIISGDMECLEMCLEMWKYLSKYDTVVEESASTVLKLELLLVGTFLRMENLKDMHSNAFKWLSSKWTDDEILSFIDGVPLKLIDDLPILGSLWNCCTVALEGNYRNSGFLMSYFSYIGSLRGVQWLDRMGVESISAVMNGIVRGHRHFSVPALKAQNLSLCHLHTTCLYSLQLFHFGVVPKQVSNQCSDESIRCAYHVIAQAFLERREVVPTDHINKAALHMIDDCHSVLCWNRSLCLEEIQEVKLKFVENNAIHYREYLSDLCVKHSTFKVLDVNLMLSTVFDWCADKHFHVTLLNSGGAVQQVNNNGDIRGEMAADLGVQQMTIDHKQTCRGTCRGPPRELCSYSSIENSSSDCANVPE